MSEPQINLNVQRIYIKDLSFESPNSPAIFVGEWKPQADMKINTQTNQLNEKQFEVVLTVTLTTKQEDKVAYLVEAQQAGVFDIEAPKEQMEALLLSYCPNLLFPYLREAVGSIIMKSGFPQFTMQPINFDALLQKARKDRKSAALANQEAQSVETTKH